MPLSSSLAAKSAKLILHAAIAIIFIFALRRHADGQRLAFYTPEQRYRFGLNDPKCSSDKQCNSEIHRGMEHGQEGKDYSLNFIEFKGDGTPYDR